MASVFQREGAWVVKWKDATGAWKTKRTGCATKLEAKRLAAALEQQAERQELGLEARPADCTMTLAELCRWWLAKRYPHGGGRNERQRLELHVCGRPIGSAALPKVTSQRLNELIDLLEEEGAAPASLNRLRSSLHSVFTRAGKAQLWTGPNPVAGVERRRVPKRAYATLRAEDVPVLLPCVDPEWVAFFAAALWTGMRKGELCGLLKSDVDLTTRTLVVARSYDNDSTKGGHADAIPIADPLVPYLEQALRRSASPWVFPAPNGSMLTDETCHPERVLRAALARAGLTEWEHVCRRCKAAGEPHAHRHPDATLRRCPTCSMKLWPRPLTRMRFHDLRHTTATLLLRARVPAHLVQRILRHASINTTLGTYGHLNVEDLREAVNQLPAAPQALALAASAPLPPAPHGAPVVRARLREDEKARSRGVSSIDSGPSTSDPAGIRTRVCAVRGHRPDR